MSSLFQNHKNLNVAADFSADKNLGTARPKNSASSSFAIPQKPKFAIIDMGSNSFRLCIFDDFNLENPKTKFVETCQLGEGFAGDLTIQKSAFQRGVSACKKFVEICERHGVSRIFAFATATVREAKNREDFISACEKLGIEIHILSENGEALCGFLGACAGVDFSVIGRKNDECKCGDNSFQKFAILDIGGASTEIAVGSFLGFKGLFAGQTDFPTLEEIKQKSQGTLEGLETFPLEFSHSFKVGAVRMTDLFGEDFEGLNEFLTCEFSKMKGEFSLENIHCFGIGGTATSLLGLLCGCENYKPQLHGFSACKSDIDLLKNQIQNMTQAERACLPFLKDKRKKIIACGGEILHAALTVFGVNEITASLTDNLEGYRAYLGI